MNEPTALDAPQSHTIGSVLRALRAARDRERFERWQWIALPCMLAAIIMPLSWRASAGLHDIGFWYATMYVVIGAVYVVDATVPEPTPRAEARRQKTNPSALDALARNPQKPLRRRLAAAYLRPSATIGFATYAVIQGYAQAGLNGSSNRTSAAVVLGAATLTLAGRTALRACVSRALRDKSTA